MSLTSEERKKLDDIVARVALAGVLTTLPFGLVSFDKYVEVLERRLGEYKELRRKELGAVVSG